MKLSPFTLIYQAHAELEQPTSLRSGSKSSRKAEFKKSSATRSASNSIKGLNSLPPSLSRTLISSAERKHSVYAKQNPIGKLKTVVHDLNRSEKVLTVALWDLDAHVGGLPHIIEEINAVQTAFTFFELRAPIPAGLVISSGVFAKWARKRFPKLIPKDEQTNLQNNFMFNDFHKFAKVVRERIGVDYLVGITQFMLAWEEQDEVYWNYFSTYDGRILMVSAYDMLEYAKKAGRPLEVAVAGIAIAQLLAILNKKIRFHENRETGCLFDFNEERDSIVRVLKKPQIEPDCLEKIEDRYRNAAEKMVFHLKNYSSGKKPANKKSRRHLKKGVKETDEYWIEQLKALGNKVEKGQEP